MTSRAIVAGLLILTAAGLARASDPAPVPACLVQVDGHTSDQPPDPVVVCRKLFPAAPFVHLPQDQRAAGSQVTLYGVVDLDVNVNFHIQNARFFDRQLNLYA